MGKLAQEVTAPVLGDGSASFTPGISERRGSTSSFYGADYLGTNSSLYSAGETVSATGQYDAFGNLVGSSGSSANPFGFAGNWGYQNDSDSGLMLLGHRYYDASTGRFLTRDPIKDGRNWYAYCGSDPIGAVDPTGQIIFYVGGEAEALATLGHAAVEANVWFDIGTGDYGTLETLHLGVGVGAMAGLDLQVGISLETPQDTGLVPVGTTTLSVMGEPKFLAGGGGTIGASHDPRTQRMAAFLELSYGPGVGAGGGAFDQSYTWVQVHGNVYDDASNAIENAQQSFPTPRDWMQFYAR